MYIMLIILTIVRFNLLPLKLDLLSNAVPNNLLRNKKCDTIYFVHFFFFVILFFLPLIHLSLQMDNILNALGLLNLGTKFEIQMHEMDLRDRFWHLLIANT